MVETVSIVHVKENMNFELCLGGPRDGEIVEHDCTEAPASWVVRNDAGEVNYIYKKRSVAEVVDEGNVATLDGPLKYDFIGWEKIGSLS